MPQSGDGDLWPTTDDDKPSKPVEDASTHQLPVPDQQEEPAPTPSASGGWFDPPSAETPEEPAEGRDEPHAKPAQQRTQPVSWPVAELERHVKNPDADATSFVRPLPPKPEPAPAPAPEEPTAFFSRQKPAADSPAWPADEDPPKSTPSSQTEDAKPSLPDTPPSFIRPSQPEKASTRTTPEPQAPNAANRARADQTSAAAVPREEKGDQAPAGQESGATDSTADQAQAEEKAQPEVAAGPESTTKPGPPEGDTTAANGDQPAKPAISQGWFGQQEIERPSKPSGDQATARISLESLAADRARLDEQSKARENDTARAGLDSGARPSRADGPTVVVRPVQIDPNAPGNRPNQVGDGTTVNLARPSLLKPDRQTEWPPPEPPRAAPQRVGPPPPEPPAPKKTRKKRPLLIAAIAIVAVIGIAAGVVFGVPGLSEKLGLTGEEAVAIDPPPSPIAYTPGLHGPDAAAPTPSKQGVESALSGPMSNSALGTATGIVIDPTTGETLYERDAGDAITPASTGKIITAAAALLSLDHTQQLVTKVVQGEQPGEVIIVGGGDPTISSLKVGNESIYPGAAHLSELVDQVKASGAQVQTVSIDESRYAEPSLAASWLPADIGAGYIAPIVPAMLDGDRQDDATVNYSPRSTDPGRTLVDEFATRMGATAAGSIDKKAPANAKVLGEIRSAPMTQLVDNMLNRSENTLGDVLAHEVAIKAGQEPTFDGASKAMLDVLRQNNFDVDGVVLRDGSGMSTENKVSAKLLAQILAVAAGPAGKDPRTAKLRPLLGGLPVAGGSGTLADRYSQGTATEGRGWVRAKTGTLTGVNSLAGIVLDKDNRPLVFAFLSTGSSPNTARPALDTVSAALRGCGCQ